MSQSNRKPIPPVYENITLVGPPEGAPDAESFPPGPINPTETSSDASDSAGATVVEGRGHIVGATSLRPLTSQGRVIR